MENIGLTSIVDSEKRRACTIVVYSRNESLINVAKEHTGGFEVKHILQGATAEVIEAATPRMSDGSINHSHVSVVILDALPMSAEVASSAECPPVSPGDLRHTLNLASAIRNSCRHAFIVLWHPDATEDARLRVAAFTAGANMVTCYLSHLEEVLSKLASIGSGDRTRGVCSCEWCGYTGMTQEELWLHQQLYHIYDDNLSGQCSACGQEVENLAVHIHEEHYPGGPQREVRQELGSAVVVHRARDNKFLMVQEFAGQGFWVPGGATDIGESVRSSAVRECLEEAGVEVQLQGLAEVHCLECPTTGKIQWTLVVFYATVVDEAALPKTVPCFESTGACWVGLEELQQLPLRHPRVPNTWFPYFAAGKPFKPLELPPEWQHLFQDVKF